MKFNCELCCHRKIKVEKRQLICSDCFKANTSGGRNYPWLKFENERQNSPSLEEIAKLIEDDSVEEATTVTFKESIKESIKVTTETIKSDWLKIVGG